MKIEVRLERDDVRVNLIDIENTLISNEAVLNVFDFTDLDGKTAKETAELREAAKKQLLSELKTGSCGEEKIMALTLLLNMGCYAEKDQDGVFRIKYT